MSGRVKSQRLAAQALEQHREPLYRTLRTYSETGQKRPLSSAQTHFRISPKLRKTANKEIIYPDSRF
jgi:hypothetical protein